MALILTANSNRPPLQGLIADSLHPPPVDAAPLAGWLPAVCYLIMILFKAVLFPWTNQAFHLLACLSAFEAFNPTCQHRPGASSSSYILNGYG